MAMSYALSDSFETRTTPGGAEIVVPKGAGGGSAEPPVAPQRSTDGASNAASGAGAGAGASAPAKTYKKSTLPLEERFALVRSVGEEVIQVRRNFVSSRRPLPPRSPLFHARHPPLFSSPPHCRKTNSWRC